MRSEQVATRPEGRVENGRNYSDKKETIDRFRVVAVDPALTYRDGFAEPCDARFYMGRSSRASVVYCSVWVHARDGKCYSGVGQAGGYGYHKKSAALAAALDSAGFKLAQDISGVGEDAMRSALLAVADSVGYADAQKTVLA